jgi:hypothetical protein
MEGSRETTVVDNAMADMLEVLEFRHPQFNKISSVPKHKNMKTHRVIKLQLHAS